MPTINAGASTAVTVAVGTYLEGTGAGMAVIGPAAVVEPLTAGDAWQVGPFDRATLVSITAGSLITYTVRDNMRDPSEADKLPLASVAAMQALVSDAGNVPALLELIEGVTDPAVFASAEVADPVTGTPQAVTPPAGATYCRISYLRTGGTVVGKVAHIAFNATSTYDAAARLAAPEVREVVQFGQVREFYFDEPLTRIDVKSDAASETAGSTVVLIEYGADTASNRVAYQINNNEFADKLSASVSTIKPFEPADFVDLSYLKIGASANGYRLFACFNAAGDADAAVKLASAADRVTVPIGTSERYLFPEIGCSRIDLKTDAGSETAGSTLVIVERGAA